MQSVVTIVAMVFSFPHNYVSMVGSFPNIVACGGGGADPC
jgi:hypothetical protein